MKKSRKNVCRHRKSRILSIERLERRCLLSSQGLALPVFFEPNLGQSDPQVDYLSRGHGYGLFLTAREAVLVLGGYADADNDGAPEPAQSVLRMQLVGANADAPVTGLDPLPGRSNYFVGHLTQSLTNVPHYARVEYEDIYPGVDVLYYGDRQRQLEYDFVVSPGADPRVIGLEFQGADAMEIDGAGNLLLHATLGDVVLQAPVIYQDVDGARQDISGGYVFLGTNRVGFDLAGYDTTRPLVIDPVLAYSTYLGGTAISPETDAGNAIAVDGVGNAHVTGFTTSTNFPTENALDTTLNFSDAFVTKLDPSGSSLVYSTYLGGGSVDFGLGIAVDGSGNAVLTGRTTSTDFPTVNAFQSTFAGGGDAFVAKLDPTGSSLVYSTYLGGSGGDDRGYGITVDASGNAYLTGEARSTNFPTTPSAYQTSLLGSRDVFVTKLNASGSLEYSTYLGGTSGDIVRDFGYGIAVDATGHAYVTGSGALDFPTTPGAYSASGGAFVTKLNPTGTALVYSTRLTASLAADNAIAVDSSGNAYITAYTSSSSYPTTPGAFQTAFGGGTDAVIAKFNASGTELVYSSYLGGSGNERGFGLALDPDGAAYVTGFTESANFPVVDPLESFTGPRDAFVAKVNPSGTALEFSTYLGSADFGGAGIALDASRNAYVTGRTSSPAFPTVNAFQPFLAGSTDAFVAKISFVANQPPTIVAQSFNVNENQTAVGTILASDPDLPGDTLTFSIIGSGPDDAKFSITPGGALSFNAAPDYDNPTDLGGTPGDNVYLVDVRVTDAAGEGASATITVNVQPVNDHAPQFTSSAAADVVENSTSVQTLAATDADLPAQTVTYSITGGADGSFFQIVAGNLLEFVTAPDYETPLDANADNVYEVEVGADDGNGLTTRQVVSVSVLNQASITGVVFVDVDQDGQFDANEPGVDGVLIELQDAGGAVLATATTSDGGFYLFEDLDPATYQLHEIQPTGVDDGTESLGNLGGTIPANDTMRLTLARTDAVDYVFAELGRQVTGGDTATIGFWQNKHGQELINAGGPALANWLSTNFANVFGNEFDNVSVANFYKQQLFKEKAAKSAGPAKVDAQFMATALSTFFTSRTLAGNVAAAYGFNVTDTGIGTKIVNVGSSGLAFGVADGTNLTIMQLLLATNAMTDGPDNILGAAKAYDTNGDDVIDAAEAKLRAMANTIYAWINEAGAV